MGFDSPMTGPAREDSSLEEKLASLEEENLQLRQLLERQSASLSHVAHELRTPLTSILGFAEILLSHEELTPAQKGFCERIQNSAYQLQEALSKLSDPARPRKKIDAPEG